MHDVAGNDQAMSKTTFTESAHMFDVTIPALEPCSCLVESFCLVHVLGNTKATSAVLMASALGLLFGEYHSVFLHIYYLIYGIIILIIF